MSSQFNRSLGGPSDRNVEAGALRDKTSRRLATRLAAPAVRAPDDRSGSWLDRADTRPARCRTIDAAHRRTAACRGRNADHGCESTDGSEPPDRSGWGLRDGLRRCSEVGRDDLSTSGGLHLPGSGLNKLVAHGCLRDVSADPLM